MDVVLVIVALLILLEGLFLVFYNKGARKLFLELGRSEKKSKSLGWIEMMIGLVLLFIILILG